MYYRQLWKSLRKIRKAEDTLDVSTTDIEQPRQRRKRFISDSDSSEDGQLPRPPIIKAPQKDSETMRQSGKEYVLIICLHCSRWTSNECCSNNPYYCKSCERWVFYFLC